MNDIQWSKQFCVISINRADLNEFGLTNEQIATLFTDKVMREIALEMQGSFQQTHAFWRDFAAAIKTVLGLEVQVNTFLAELEQTTLSSVSVQPGEHLPHRKLAAAKTARRHRLKE